MGISDFSSVSSLSPLSVLKEEKLKPTAVWEPISLVQLPFIRGNYWLLK